MKLALSIALTVLVWHSAQWNAILHQDRSGEWQTVEGPSVALANRLDYDPQMHTWFVREGGFLPDWGWTLERTPLREGDVLTLGTDGLIRVESNKLTITSQYAD